MVKPVTEKSNNMDRANLILEAIKAAGPDGITVKEIMKVTNSKQASVWNAVSGYRTRWNLQKKKEGTNVRYSVAAPSVEVAAPSVPVSKEKATPERHWKTRKIQAYEQHLPAIWRLAAEISVFGDRNMTVRDCFLSGEEQHFTQISQVGLIRRPQLVTLDEWEKQFEAARAALLDELMKIPEPVVETKEILAPLERYNAQDLFAEIGRRMGALMDRPTGLLPTIQADVPHVHQPEHPQKKMRAIRISIIGLLDSQRSAITTYPPIAHRIKNGSIELSFCSKDKARLNLRAGEDYAIALTKLISHKDWGQIESVFPKDRITKTTGISAIRDAVLGYAMKHE